ncbi:MAG: amidohydrolase family protein, partial [Ilumatobacteraceae bacterium]
MGTTSRSTFDDVYLAGVPRALPKPSRPVEAGLAAAAPTGPIALGGVVVRSDGVMPQGWVVVADGHIADIVAQKPSGVTTIDTGGVITPGLIDLHGHPEFNVFAPWEPPKTFINRSQWRGSPIYQQLVRDPWDQLTKNGQSPSAKKAMTRYAEVRALVGGVT